MTRVCEQCGGAISKRNNKRFCSGSCRTKWINENVGNPARTPAARAKIAAARRGKPTTSGPLSDVKKANISAALKGRKISDEHRAKTRQTMKRLGHKPPVLRGPANPKWKGGQTLIRAKDYTNPLYVAFRDTVFARDGFRCVDCGWTPSKTAKQRRGPRDRLHAHHLLSWAEHPEARYDPANGITLCHGCHAARHRGVPPPRVLGARTLADLESGPSEAA